MTNDNPAQPPALPVSRTTEQGDSTGGIIPYKNPHALASYYLGIFSIIPLLGFILAVIAVPLGISGLKQRAKRPVIGGSIHAWVGIVFGSLSLVAHLFVVVAMVIAASHHR